MPLRSISRKVFLPGLVALLVLGALVILRPHVAAAATYQVPSSIDSTGSVDTTAQLNNFIASVPDGSVITFPSGGTFRVDGTLRFTDRRNLTIEGRQSTIFTTAPADRDRRHVSIVRGDHLTIRDLHVDGANPYAGTGTEAWDSTKEAQHGFEILGSDAVLLERVGVTDVYGDFVYLGRDLDQQRWASNITVRDSRFERNGRQGIAITAAQDVHIHGNYIGEVRQSTFDIEPNSTTWGARRVLVENNVIGPGRHLFLAAHGYPGPVEDISFLNNQLRGKTMWVSVYAPTGTRRKNFSFIGNTTDVRASGPNALLRFTRVDGITVENNVHAFYDLREMTAVETWESCGSSVSGNQFPGVLRDLVENGGYNCPVVSSTTQSTTTTSTTTSTSTTSTTTTAPPPAPTATNGLVVTADAPTVTADKGSWTASVRWTVTNSGTPIGGTTVIADYAGDHKFGASGRVSCVTDGRGQCSVAVTVTNKNSTLQLTATTPAPKTITVVRP